MERARQPEPAHFVAGGAAIFLILFGPVTIVGRHRLHRMLAMVGLVAMAAVYLAAAVVVAGLGAPRGDSGDATAGEVQGQNSHNSFDMAL